MDKKILLFLVMVVLIGTSLTVYAVNANTYTEEAKKTDVTSNTASACSVNTCDYACDNTNCPLNCGGTCSAPSCGCGR